MTVIIIFHALSLSLSLQSLHHLLCSVVECHHLKTENEIPIEFFMNMNIRAYITMLCALHVRVHILGNNQITNVACKDDTYAWQYKISDVLG